MGPTSSYGFKYLIITFTGARANAGTSANVWIILKGSKEESEPRLLMNPNHPLHCRGDVNAFQVSFDRPLGELHSLMIGHDNSGKCVNFEQILIQ